MRMRNEPLSVGCELADGTDRYRVVRVEPSPNPQSFGHAWAERGRGVTLRAGHRAGQLT
jgi:hypothetical protein